MALSIDPVEVKFLADLAALKRDMEQVKSIVGNGASQMERQMAGVSAGFGAGFERQARMVQGALGAIGVSLTAAGFGTWIKGAIDAADRLNDLSKSTDLAASKLAGLQLAARQSGGELGGIADSINKLSMNIGKDAEKFARIGITAKEPIEAFKQLADIYASLEDPQLRAAVAAEALGRGWQASAPLLKEGGAAIQSMIDKGERLSGMTQGLVDASDEFNDRMAEFQTALSGTANALAADMLPLLTEFVESLTDTADAANQSTASFNPLTEALRALIVLGGNVGFVFRGIGTELGGLAAQAAAVARGDLAGAAAIGDMMKADAEKARAAFDEWERKMMAAGTGAVRNVRKAIADEAARLEKEFYGAAAGADTAALRRFVSGDEAAKKAAQETERLAQAEFAARQKIMQQALEHERALIDQAHAKGLLSEKEYQEELYKAQIAGIARRAAAVQRQYDAETDPAKRVELQSRLADLNAEAAKAADAFALATIKLDAASKSYLDTLKKENESLDERLKKARAELAAIGLSAEEKDRLAAAADQAAAAQREEAAAAYEAGRAYAELTGNAAAAAYYANLRDLALEQAAALREIGDLESQQGARRAAVKAAEDSAKAWENFSRDIEQSLTDALMRGFESGEGFGENFVKTLQNTLKTAALKLAVQMVVQPVMGSLGQSLGYTQGGAGGGGLGGMSNIFSPISNIATSSIGGSAFGAGMLSGVSESLLGASFVGPSASLAGNASIAAGASFGSFLPAIGIGLGLLSLFGGDLFGGKEKPPEINIANVPKGTKWAASAGAGPFGELQMAGKHLGETEQEVQKMVDALLKPMIQADTALAQLLTGAEVKAISGALEGWTSGEVEFEGEAQVQEMVKARFAIISDTIGGWVDALADTVTGTSEEVYTALGQILAQRNAEGAQSIAEQILGADDGRFSEEGENLAATFNRLMSSLTTVNAAFDLLDQNLLQISADSGVWADKLVDAFGGLESLQGSVAAYYDKYYSDAEKVANSTAQITKAFDKLGYELPDSKEELRKWIDSIPLLTDEQRKTYAELIKLAPAFSDLSEAMAKTAGTALDAAAAERSAEIEARRAMRKAAQSSMDAARDGLNTLKTGLSAAEFPASGGYAGGSYLSAAELERYSGFVEYLTEAGAELQKLADLNVAGEMDGAINSIKAMMAEAGRELASRLSIERLLAGNVGGAIGAASAPGMAGLTWEGNAGAFNAQIAEVQARAAAGLLNAANANALTIPNIDSVLDHLIQTAGENPGGRGLLGVRAAAEAYSRAITDGVEQEIREGLAANLGRVGLESVSYYFGQLGDQAAKLAAASEAANDALAQTNAAIGRLTSVSSVFGQSAAAAYYGFMDGGAEGAMYLSDPATGARISQSALIASAAQIAAGVVTTADAAAAAKRLSDQFADKRGASLLLDGLKQYDAASFENAFTRMNDALIKGALNEAQYTELFGLAVDTFTGASEEAAKVADTFERLREAARSLADELMVDRSTSRLTRDSMVLETRRQWDEAMARATTAQDASGLESSARNYLRAIGDATGSGDVYDQGFARVMADLRGLEQLFPAKPATKTMDDVVAELNAMRSDMRAMGAQQSSNEQKLNRLVEAVHDGNALQVKVVT